MSVSNKINHLAKNREDVQQGIVGFQNDIPRPMNLEKLNEELPPLYTPGAKTIARDRWERMVSTHVIPAPAQEIWQVLTDPSALNEWFAVCHGSLLQTQKECILDFEDGDFFLCRPIAVQPPNYLEWRWRWLGIGPAWSVQWYLEPVPGGTRVTVVDEALNPPARTGHYRGEGWPGILDILAAYVRTKVKYRWPCRSQSYILVEIPVTVYGAWDRLFSPAGIKWWLHGFFGAIQPGQKVVMDMGDASGSVDLVINDMVGPSYNTYPFITFSMRRPFWQSEVPGRLFLEPAGWGHSILQIYQTGWENLGPALQCSQRATIVGYWAEAFWRACQICEGPGYPSKASPWVLSESERVDLPSYLPDFAQTSKNGSHSSASLESRDHSFEQLPEVRNHDNKSDL